MTNSVKNAEVKRNNTKFLIVGIAITVIAIILGCLAFVTVLFVFLDFGLATTAFFIVIAIVFGIAYWIIKTFM